MENQFVTLDIAKKLKEIGFDQECLAIYLEWYNDENKIKLVSIDQWSNMVSTNKAANPWIIVCNAPLWQQVIDWFRKKHSMIISTDISKTSGKFYYTNTDLNRDVLNNGPFDTYESCREKSILKAIEIIKTIEKQQF